MNKLRLGIILFLSIIGIGSCEKDDICVDGDVPLLVIEFYDIDDTETLKSVTALRVVGLEQSSTVDTFTDRSDLNTISVPLKTNEDTTSFLLISNSASDDDGNETGNIDTVTFSYSRLETFISRGCGFIITYEDLTAALEAGTDNWIQDIEIVQTEVINSDSTNVKIFY